MHDQPSNPRESASQPEVGGRWWWRTGWAVRSVLVTCALFGIGATAAAQTTPSSRLTDGVIRHVRFTGNEEVSTGELEQLVRTKTNRKLFGVDALTPWYFIHRVTGGRFGESPSFYDPTVTGNDIERIRLFYESLGFFRAAVDTIISEYRRDKVEVTFLIREGEQSVISTLSYAGMPSTIAPRELERFHQSGIPTRQRLPDGSFRVDRPYSLTLLREQQDHIIDFLKEQGYAAVQRDSVQALVRPQPDDPLRLDVRYRIRPGEVYHFGDLDVQIFGPADAGTAVVDTFAVAAPDSGRIRFIRESTANTRSGVILSTLNFMPGERYSQIAFQNSVNELQGLGMLTVNRFGFGEPEVSDGGRLLLPGFIQVRVQPKHSLRMELFGLERYGFGTGVGFNYNNNNVFRQAENFSFRLNTSLEYVSAATIRDVLQDPQSAGAGGSTIFQSYDATLQYSVPRLNAPFRFLDTRPAFRNAYTRYSLSFNRANQLYFDVNSDIRFNLRYDVTHSRTRFSGLDLFELSLIDTDPSPEFEENLSQQFPDDTLQIIRIKEDFRPQVNSLIGYTHRVSNTDLIRRDRGRLVEYSLSIGGNLPYLVDRFVATPGVVEGTIRSPFSVATNLDYNQFVKATVDYRRYHSPLPDMVFAWRLFGGFAQPFSARQSVPLNQRFFAGGSNDIRAWPPFRLGPGSIPPDEVTINGGEIKLAGFVESRWLTFRNVLSGNWHTALFVDAGNVWYGPSNELRNDRNTNLLNDGVFRFGEFHRQIAIGSGFGMRIDWEFVVARVDFSFRIHDVQEGWLASRKLYFNFGIGHSF